ncbi:unnamed protein product [Discosporangium mesarthrocarpum]
MTSGLLPVIKLCLLILMATAVSLCSATSQGSIKCLFSDIDGTLVHYYETEEDGPAPGPPKVLALPPSKTGRQAFISRDTLDLVARIRAKGTRFVLISGVRYSTFAARLPFLPRADAYVIENGGRIFYPRDDEDLVMDGSAEKTNATQEDNRAVPITAHPAEALVEDLAWREQLTPATGPASQDAIPPGERTGPLWDVFRQLVDGAYTVDTATYFTMLRVKIEEEETRVGVRTSVEQGKKRTGAGQGRGKGSNQSLSHLLGLLPAGLRVVTNFGLVDICPERSGKLNAAVHIATKRFGISLENCASMGDDDNDIDIAKAMGKGAFITGFSSQSIADAAKANSAQFRVARERGVRAAEEMLQLVLQSC